MSEITPFQISIPDSSLKDLQTRLSLTRLPDELDAASWSYGTPLSEVSRLLTHWKDNYSWRNAEKHINSTLPQFSTSISVSGFEPLSIHFVHKLAPNKNAIPLLFVHGWPGSFLEVSKIIDELTSPRSGKEEYPAFHVVAPSLPNYGFSSGVSRKGFALSQYAETCHKLMLKLGYTEYVAQGGDWGYYITRAMAIRYGSKHVKATHTNFNQGNPPSLFRHPFLAVQHAITPYTQAEKDGLARRDWFERESSGYKLMQSTRPQTLGYSLSDSPIGLLSWILEKLHDWSDSYPWTDDEILTWISIYWFSTAGPAASLRIYYEVEHENDDPSTRVTRNRAIEYIGNGVKLGLTRPPRENRGLPVTWTATQGDVVFERSPVKGGHFFAWECPEELVADVREMFGKGGGAFGVVKGKDGY